VLVDTREKVWEHIRQYLIANDIPYKMQTLQSGDYSFILEYDDQVHIFVKQIVIERKNSLTELAACFSTERARFEREFERLKKSKTMCFLLVENSSFDGIYKGNYRTQMNPKSYEASLISWLTKYNIIPIFCDKENSGRVIHNIFKQYLRNYLLDKI